MTKMVYQPIGELADHGGHFVAGYERLPDYVQFIATKRQANENAGFEPLWIPDWLKHFQQHLTAWAVRKGRAALFEDCGLGKTPQQLVWSQNVVMKTNRPVLILTPLAVSHQTCREAEKFGIEASRSANGTIAGKIVVTNYERMHHFNPRDFAGVVLDESSIIKNFKGAIRTQVSEFMRLIEYRLLCTATAAPNDYWELGTSSDALGYLGFRDMITQFFKQETTKDYMGWGRTKYRFRGHAEVPFWKWVCSWARVCRKPSDLGFDDGEFVLPGLTENEIRIDNSTPRPGFLLSIPARDLHEQREELKITLTERCEKASEIIESHNRPSVTWCHTNAEADRIEKITKDAQQVSGSMADERKEEILLAFQSGQLNRLVIKPKIGCFGLNWQHCHDVVVFPSHSWEQYYQAVRRCLRFGQQHPVTVNIITTEGQSRVMASLKRKSAQADRMFSSLVQYVNQSLAVDAGWNFNTQERIPSWL